MAGRIDFVVRDCEINSADCVHGFGNGPEVYADEVFDVQVQIPVQHLDGRLGTAVVVCVVAFPVFAVSVHVHQGVPVDGNQVDFLRVVIY